jgi:cytochrome P450
MLAKLTGAWDDLQYLLRARDNLVAAWPKSYYRREFIPIRILGRWMFVVNNPAGVQWVMVSNEKNYQKSPSNRQTLKPLLGNGLFVSEGPLWARQRRTASPSTHGSRLPEYARIVVECGQEMIGGWNRLADDAVVDVTEPFTLVTAEIISRIMFGYRLDERGTELFEAFKEYQASHGRVHLLEILGMPSWLPRPGWGRGRSAVKKFDRVILEILAEGRKRQPTGAPTLLDMLLSFRDGDGRPMDPELIRDEMASIFLAGHETTAITLAWAFSLLARHPEVEARLHEEIDRVLGGRTPEFADVASLVYARAIIDETLRLYPPVHVFSRQAIGRDELSGHPVPAGSFITISSWLLHRHKLYWEEPEAFRPERFLPANAAKVQHFAYIPFGAGSRICMGKHLGLMEAVLLFAMCAQRFRLRLPEGAVVEPLARMTLRPSNGLPMRIQRRDPR